MPTEARPRKLRITSLILPASLVVAGTVVILASFSVDVFSSTSLEVPGPAIYIFAFGMILVASGLVLGGRALSGTLLGPGGAL